MQKKSLIAALAALTLSVVPAFAGVQINFSQDGSANGGLPGWRVSDADGMGISEMLEIGSNGADGLDFLRVSSATSSTSGVDVLGFIVSMPDMQIANTLLPAADGIFIDRYALTFAGGATTIPGGFRISDAANLGLPYLTADISLVDKKFTTLGTNGSVESSVTFINLTNVQLVNGGGFFPTLAEFAAAMNAGGGADFLASVSSAGTNISPNVLAGATVVGSSSGSVFAVPEPGTLLLLVAGAVLAVRRRNA